MKETGVIQAVFDQNLGSALSVASGIGDSTLYVQDISYFAPLHYRSSGLPQTGKLRITDIENTETDITYTGIDEDTSALTGVSGLTNAYNVFDTVVTTNPVATVRYAEVQLDDEVDTIRARVPFSFYDRVYEGTRDVRTDETAQRVIVELKDEYEVVDLLGEAPVYDGTFSSADEGTTLSPTGNTYQPGSPICETSFVAPSTGRVLVVVSARIQAAVAGINVLITHQIATGSDGTGDIEAPAADANALQNGLTRDIRASVLRVVEGLHGGQTYYAQTYHKQQSGVGTYLVDSRRIQIIPA